ncbi:MAG: PA2779 family protein [Gammaproteobacteria bacterium]|jgi:hypothetical protein
MKRLVLQITLLSFFCTGMTMPAQAAVLATGDYLAASARAEHLTTINAVLARDDVRQQLIAHGVDPADAAERVAQLPDAELAQLAEQMEELPAGGSALAIIGATFLVLLILELTGVINIFNSI